MNVSLSSGIRSALASIQSSASEAEVVQKRLATGKKVNSALDNPANFFTSSGLKNRSSDLSRLLDGIAQGAKTLEAADKAIKSLTRLVESAQGAARQALQNASVNLSVVSTAAIVGGAAALTTAGNLVVKAGATTTTLTLTGTSTVQDVLDGLNAAGTGIKAELGADNKLTITSLKGESLDTTGSTAGVLTALNLPAAGPVARVTATTNTTRETLAKQFDDLRTQIDQLATDAGYNGINLLNGDDLSVQFNEKNTSSLTIKGVTFNSAGLGIKASTNTFQADSDINAALSNLTKAMDSLRAQASTFGSNLSVVQTRQDFTKDFIDTLDTGADQLVLADQNEEAAKLLTLNTRQQLSQTALSLASQASQGVLKLF